MTAHDRYVSFIGIACDAKADRVMADLHRNLKTHDTRWTQYFDKKLAEKSKMGHDNLYFVGSQVNAIRGFFDEVADEAALVFLEEVEETCC